MGEQSGKGRMWKNWLRLIACLRIVVGWLANVNSVVWRWKWHQVWKVWMSFGRLYDVWKLLPFQLASIYSLWLHGFTLYEMYQEQLQQVGRHTDTPAVWQSVLFATVPSVQVCRGENRQSVCKSHWVLTLSLALPSLGSPPVGGEDGMQGRPRSCRCRQV